MTDILKALITENRGADQQRDLRHHHYLYGLAVDSGDPQNVIVSPSVGPGRAYSIEDAYLNWYSLSGSSNCSFYLSCIFSHLARCLVLMDFNSVIATMHVNAAT
jgi:hypothetical protein